MSMESTENEVTNPGKPPKKRRGQPWWAVLIMATVPTLITSYFSYRASRVEAEAKAAQTKVRAEAGYKKLVDAIEVLQKHDEENTKLIANLNGHIAVIEAWFSSMRPHRESTGETHLELQVPSNAPDRRTWKPNFPPKLSAPASRAAGQPTLPHSLDEALAK